MQSLLYSSTVWYDCETAVDAIICVDSSLTATGAPYIEGTILYQNYCINSSVGTVLGCETVDKVYNYAIIYDEGQLLDPDTPLLLSQIDGFHIKDCLFTYIDYWITHIMDTAMMSPSPSPSSSPSESPSVSPSSSPSTSPSESPSTSPSTSPSSSPSTSPSSSPSSSPSTSPSSSPSSSPSPSTSPSSSPSESPSTSPSTSPSSSPSSSPSESPSSSPSSTP